MANLDFPGARLRALRTDRGMTGLALAQALDVTKSTISYWEAGRTELPWAICLALEALYGVSARWLTHGEDPMWLAAPRGSQAVSNEQIRIRFLSRDLGFTRTGQAVAPHPDSPFIRVPAVLLAEILGETITNVEALFLWRADDSEMVPHIPLGAWVLLDVSPDACKSVKDHGIYLLRLSPDQAPILRRLAKDPLSGDLLVACDVAGRVPLRLDHRAKKTGWMVLARACWAGSTLA